MPGTTRTRVYRAGVLEAENFPVADISVYLGSPDTMVWVDLLAPDEADIRLVAGELKLHPLAVTDALTPRERPKLDHYSTHDFLNVYDVRFDPATDALTFSELAAFVTPQALITVRKDDGFDMDAVVHRWDTQADLTRYGVGALVYGLLDEVVDGHFASVQMLDEAVESLEDLLFDDSTSQSELQRRTFALRKGLVRLRRAVLPMREVVSSFMRRSPVLVPSELAPFFQDVYDHVLRVSEWTESIRDLIGMILDSNLTQQGNRLNVITKKVTSWAAIIAVPTAITGWYGQNIPYPGYAEPAGLIASSVLIIGLSFGLFWAFRRADWL